MIIKNLSLVFFSRAFTAGVAFCTMLLLMWVLNIEDFAKYSFYFTFFTFCSVIPNIGVNNHIVLDNDNKDYKIAVIENRQITCIVLVIVTALFGLLFKIDEVLILSCISGFISSIYDLNLSIVQSSKNMKNYAFVMPIKTMSIFCAALISLLFKENFLFSFFSILLIFFLFSFIVWFIFNFKQRLRPKFNIEIYQKSKNFLIYEVATLILIRCEVFILSYYLGKKIIEDSDLANYWASYNFILIISIIGTTMSSLILPYLNDKKLKKIELDNVVRKTSILMIILIGILFLFSYVLSEFFINKYSGLHLYILFMSIGVFLSFISNIDRLKIMAGMGSNEYANKVVIGQLVFAIVTNLILIYYYAIFGAVLSYLLVRLFGYIMLKFEISKHSKNG